MQKLCNENFDIPLYTGECILSHILRVGEKNEIFFK